MVDDYTIDFEDGDSRNVSNLGITGAGVCLVKRLVNWMGGASGSH